MFGQVLAIARNTFVESMRQPIMFVLVLGSGLLQVFNTLLSAYSMGYTEETEVSGDDKLLLDMGLATVLVCATLLAAFIATSVLCREIDNKTALTVISKPVGRPLFILGKYLGVAAAITVAVIIMLVFFQFAIRHTVMSTARDEADGPVLLFGGLAVLLSIGLGIWGNFFYGWVFSSTTIGALLPASLVAYVCTLTLNKEWHWQSPAVDFKPQIMLASACVLLAMLVFSAVAIAASTRLKQVMTIVACAGVFILGLLSNHLLGRYAFQNRVIASVGSVEQDLYEPTALRDAGDSLIVELERPPRTELRPGDSFYYGPDPSGASLAVPAHPRFRGDPNQREDVRGPGAMPALVVRSVDDLRYTIVNVGGLPVERPPRPGDHVFAGPTEVFWPARAAWSVVPNLQFFWLVDAITQGHPIPGRYVGLLAAYSVTQIAGLLALATLLFQGRDVG